MTTNERIVDSIRRSTAKILKGIHLDRASVARATHSRRILVFHAEIIKRHVKLISKENDIIQVSDHARYMNRIAG